MMTHCPARDAEVPTGNGPGEGAQTSGYGWAPCC